MSQVLDHVVSARDSGIAVVDRFHDVVLCNPRAEELGLVRNRPIEDRAWAAPARCCRDRVSRVESTSAPRTAPTAATTIAVRGVARLLGDGPRFVVLFADDDSEHVPHGGDPPRLRRQRQPRAEDPVGAMGLLAEALLESADDPEAVRALRPAGASARRSGSATWSPS